MPRSVSDSSQPCEAWSDLAGCAAKASPYAWKEAEREFLSPLLWTSRRLVPPASDCRTGREATANHRSRELALRDDDEGLVARVLSRNVYGVRGAGGRWARGGSGQHGSRYVAGMRPQRNPLYQEREAWQLSPRGWWVWRAVLAVLVVVLISAGLWIGVAVLLAGWAGGEVLRVRS
jgi:hypothetical protein